MIRRQLKRKYRITGLGRQLYSGIADWPEGAFENVNDDEGILTLAEDNVVTRAELDAAIERLDLRAERFRVAVSRRLLRTIRLRLQESLEPDVDPQGGMRVNARAGATVECGLTVTPGPPPKTMPQLPSGATRWVTTLAETSSFSQFPDELVKRYYLVIEELWPQYKGIATSLQTSEEQHFKYLRHFVSHSELHNDGPCKYIAQHLPSAVSSLQPFKVRFDRSLREHRDFVSSHVPAMCALANWLLDQAIEGLPPEV